MKERPVNGGRLMARDAFVSPGNEPPKDQESIKCQWCGYGFFMPHLQIASVMDFDFVTGEKA